MSDWKFERVSPSGLGTYAICPRRYEFDRVWDVETPEETRRYLDRGIVLHETIERVCEALRSRGGGSVSDDDIRRLAGETFEAVWDAETDRNEYYSDAHYRFDRSQSRSAIEHYFDGPGIGHARNSVANEVWVSFERDGIGLHGRIDNVVRTNDGFLVIDYKTSFGRIISHRSTHVIDEHLDKEDRHPGRVKSLFQAATYIEGLRAHDLYEPGADVSFTYYALLHDTSVAPALDGVSVTASGRGRDVTAIYEGRKDSVWALIQQYYHGIVEGAYEPEPWTLIRENACDDCPFRGMCPDFIAGEVRLVE